jgi:hypothetical protein
MRLVFPLLFLAFGPLAAMAQDTPEARLRVLVRCGLLGGLQYLTGQQGKR